MKKLLTFAHRGEAQAFLEGHTFKALDFFFDGLFESDQYYLLITGEGPHNASEKTISVLAKYKEAISEVFNIGIAGSLNPKLKKNDLRWIRTAFAHHAEKLEFKSYSSPYKGAHHDCMTAYGRVLSLEERKTLSHFADLVDRELWAVASAAQFFKIPFYALKIVSDEMVESSEDICKFVKNEASFFSQKLLEEFNFHLKNDIQKQTPKIVPHNLLSGLLADSDFYFTTSQQRKLTSLLDNLEKKGVNPIHLNFSAIKNREISPKDRSRLLLQYFNDELNPMAKMIRESLAKKLDSLDQAAIHCSYDPDFEQDWLQLSMRVQSSRDLEKIKNALKIFSYEDFKSIFNGQIE